MLHEQIFMYFYSVCRSSFFDTLYYDAHGEVKVTHTFYHLYPGPEILRANDGRH